MGWYTKSYYEINLSEVTAADTANLKKNIVLTAKWEEKTPDKKYIKITYDSKGGSKVKADEFECVNDSYTIESFPKNPTKDGYTFRAWEDKHGKVILTGAKLTCENITLYAAWDKKEEPKPDTKVSYKCNEGVLNGDKCVIEKDAKTKCPSNTYEFNGKCVTLAASAIDKNQINRVCGKSTVLVDNNGHTQEVQGTLTYVGDSVDKAQYWYCAYGATDESQYECTTHGHKWVGKLNKCYRSTGNPGQNITYSCKNSNSYVYLSVSDANSLRQNSNLSGCFPYVSKTSYCEDGFTLIDGKCNKKVDAIKVTE